MKIAYQDGAQFYDLNTNEVLVDYVNFDWSLTEKFLQSHPQYRMASDDELFDEY